MVTLRERPTTLAGRETLDPDVKGLRQAGLSNGTRHVTPGAAFGVTGVLLGAGIVGLGRGVPMPLLHLLPLSLLFRLAKAMKGGGSSFA